MLRPKYQVWLFAGVLLCSGCSLFRPHYERPTVTVVDVTLRKGNVFSQTLAVRFNVSNPNAGPLPVRSLHADVSVAGEAIASGTSDRAFVVPANGEQEFDMTIKANLALVLLKMGNRLGAHADSIDYQLDGAASVDLPFVHNLPFHQSGSFALR